MAMTVLIGSKICSIDQFKSSKGGFTTVCLDFTSFNQKAQELLVSHLIMKLINFAAPFQDLNLPKAQVNRAWS